jgi:SAM-dependent methyltransferase
VVATDLYSIPIWEGYSPRRMFTEPERFAPYDFRRDRLTVCDMDGRALNFPENAFDGVFCSSSIEHFGDFDDVANAAYEMGRVLKPGGLLTLSTEYLISGPDGSHGWAGVLLFRRSDLERYIVEASGLETVDTLRTEISEPTLASEWELSRYAEDQACQLEGQGDYPQVSNTVYSHYPALVLRHEGHVYVSVHLALRKTSDYPATPNGWARPTLARGWDSPAQSAQARRIASSARSIWTSVTQRVDDALRRPSRER